MRYRALKFWVELGKNCRIFLTNRLEESLHPLAKNWWTYLPTKKKFDDSRLSPEKLYLPHYITISVL